MSTDDTELPPLYTIEHLRDWLGLKSTRYIERNVSGWPHITVAREVRFTAEDMVAIRDLHRRGPGTQTPAFSGQVTRGSRPH